MNGRHEVSIEVLDDAFPASSWLHAYRDLVVRTAIESRALEWRFHEHGWGVVLELAFRDEADFGHWRELPAVVAALDAVPGRVIVKRGWGGTSGMWEPRDPRPLAGSGAAEIPIPKQTPSAGAPAGAVAAPRDAAAAV